MKRILFICAFLVLVFANTILCAQDILKRSVNLYFETSSIEDYLDTLALQAGVRFAYSNAIEPNRSITIRQGEYTLEQALDSALIEYNVLYLLNKNLVIISPQPEGRKPKSKVLIRGRVTANQKPVPFASVYYKQESIGTISNAEGDFELNIPNSLIKDTLYISSLGYQESLLVPCDYLTDFINIELQASTFQIEELIVRPEEAISIVDQAIANVPKNYPAEPARMKAFFREANKQDNSYIALTEAMIDIDKKAYDNDNEDVVKIIKGRKGDNIESSELLNLVVEGGLIFNLRLDIAKYGSFFFDEKASSITDYEFLNNTEYRGRQTYVIGFDMKEKGDYAGFTGQLYFDAISLALVHAEFELSPKGMKYARSALVRKSARGFKIKPLYAKYSIDYRFYDSVWNLNHVRSDIAFKVRKKKVEKNKGFSCVFSSTSEFVVTEKDQNAYERIKYREAFKLTDVLVEQIEQVEGFNWSEENIIVPEEPLLKTLERLNFGEKQVVNAKL